MTPIDRTAPTGIARLARDQLTRLGRSDGWLVYGLGVMAIAVIVVWVGDGPLDQPMLTTMGMVAAAAVMVGSV